MNEYVKNLHNALCEMCVDNGLNCCGECDYKRPFHYGEYHGYIYNEEEVLPGVICNQMTDGMMFCIVDDEVVAAADEGEFIKLKDVDWETVSPFFEFYICDEGITEAMWNEEKVSAMDEGDDIVDFT